MAEPRPTTSREGCYFVDVHVHVYEHVHVGSSNVRNPLVLSGLPSAEMIHYTDENPHHQR